MTVFNNRTRDLFIILYNLMRDHVARYTPLRPFFEFDRVRKIDKAYAEATNRREAIERHAKKNQRRRSGVEKVPRGAIARIGLTATQVWVGWGGG